MTNRMFDLMLAMPVLLRSWPFGRKQESLGV